MLYLDGQIWSIHPMAIATARDAAQTWRLEAAEDQQKKDDPRPKRKSKRNAANESFGLMSRSLSVDEMPMEMINGTAVITISDVIVSWCSYYFTSHPALQQCFNYLQQYKPQNGAVLLIDSPGGMAKGSAETIDALDALQDAGVKVTAQVAGGCFSAAYKIASRCRGGIYVHRMDEVGSIGTKIIIDDASERYAQLGVKPVAVTNEGAIFKTLGEPGLPITDEQIAFLTEYTQQIFGEFKRCVMTGRGLTEEQFSAVSDGRWWLPDEAKALGLIDGVRTTTETLASLQPAARSIFLKEESDMLTAAEKKAAEEKEAAEKAAAEKAASEKAATEKAAADKAAEEKAAAEKASAEKAAAEKAAADKATAESQGQLGELARWVEKFGAENGTKWFLEAGCDYTQALERHVELQKKQIETVTTASQASEKLLKEVGEKLGQLDPLHLEKKAAKEEAGGKTAKEGMTLAEIMSERNKK
jgi:ClpP class serine protease